MVLYPEVEVGSEEREGLSLEKVDRIGSIAHGANGRGLEEEAGEVIPR